MMMTGADISAVAKMRKWNSVKEKSNCVGYTILAVDKGINCDGDTVKLQRVHGFYEVVSAY
jgi:hypothetical protein